MRSRDLRPVQPPLPSCRLTRSRHADVADAGCLPVRFLADRRLDLPMTVARSSAHIWSTVTTLVCSLLTLARIDLAHAQEPAAGEGCRHLGNQAKAGGKGPVGVRADRVQERAIV